MFALASHEATVGKQVSQRYGRRISPLTGSPTPSWVRTTAGRPPHLVVFGLCSRPRAPCTAEKPLRETFQDPGTPSMLGGAVRALVLRVVTNRWKKQVDAR